MDPCRWKVATSSGALVLAVLLAACAGCRVDDLAATSWTPVGAAELTAEQREQLAAAESARDALAKELVGALSAELSEGGPAAAILVCRDRAPGIAAAVSAQREVRIGRTSWKLRNPENAGPAWTAALLADRPEEPRLAAAPDGRLGATFPIRTLALCTTCHGPADALDGEVRGALASLYPRDRATGFREGELRGWFWVEVPAAER